MATRVPAPVDTSATPVVTRPVDRAPAPVPPGPGSTGQIPTARTPVGPPETVPPAVTPGPGIGQSTGTTTATTPAVIELPVDTTGGASATIPNITPTVRNLIEVLANGTIVIQNATALNFTGSGVSVTSNNSTAVITITANAGSYGNSNVSAFLAGFGSNIISTTGNVTGGYILGNGSQLTGITAASSYGNANVVANLAALGSNPVSTTGNVTGGNVLGGANVNAATHTGTTVSVSANVTGGNILTAGLISATSTITSAANITGGNLITAGQVIASGLIQSGTGLSTGGYLSVNGTTDLHDTTVTGNLSATGNITANVGSFFVGNGSQLTGIAASYGNANVVANLAALGSNPVSTTGNVTGGNILGGANVNATTHTGTTVSVSANITGGNLLTGGLISATSTITSAANVNGGNLNAAGLSLSGNVVSALVSAANITTTANISGGYILGNGSQLTGIAASYGNADVVANLAALGTNPVSTTGNVTGGNILGNGRALTGVLFSGTSDATAAGLTVDDFYLSASTALTVTNSGASAYLFDQYPGNNPTIYAVAGSTLAFRLAVTGHPFLIQSSAANYSTGLNHVTTSGTVATDSSAQGQVAGTLYWKIPSNIVGTYTYQCSAHAGMVGNIVVSSPTAGSFASLGVTGNITGGNILTGGLVSATGNITGGNVLGGANVNATTHTGTTVSVSGNITGGNVLTGGLVSATGTITSAANITGGNVLTGGLISATSTITSAANITGGNLLTAGLISATGNVTGGNLIGIYANGTSNISIPTISANILFSTAGNANVLVIANTGIVANVLAATTATPANGVGYIGLPVSSVTSTGTLTIADAGKLVYITTTGQTVTIPANGSVAFPIGTAITFIAGPSATTLSIAITTDTMYLASSGTTGTRTLAAYGMATAVKVAATTWFINGSGLT
jgi:hypothetical protein